MSLEREVKESIEAGAELVSIAEIDKRLAVLGYERNKSMRADGIAKNLTTGNTYPSRTYSVRELDTKVSAYHYQNARRDRNFKSLQTLRQSVFAVYNDRLVSI